MPAIPEVPGKKLAIWFDAVVSSFGVKDWVSWCRENGIAVDQLSEHRTRFLAAGFAALQGTATDERWIQIEASLTDDPNCSRLLNSGFVAQVESFLLTGKARCFSFLQKPPGLRLRFLTCDPEFRNEIGQWFTPIAPGPWTFGCYEPELHQFGGMVGLALAHEYFTVESLAVLKYRDCMLRGQQKIPAHEFSLLVLHALFSSVTEDEWEEWDIWCGQLLTGRLDATDLLAPPNGVEALRDELFPLLRNAQFARGRMSDEEAEIWDFYESSVHKLAIGVRYAAHAGEMLWPMRQILPFWAIFHWNRMGFDFRLQKRMAALMFAILSPKW
jgi:thiopeptide-type bacteriocin biosynthesis protein